MTEELPKGWAKIRLADVGQWYGGATPSKSKSEFWENGVIPWISPKDMRQEVLREIKDRITEEAVESSPVRLVPSNSVVFVVRSGILERKFPVALTVEEATLNQDMKAIHPYEGVDSRWIAWSLRWLEQSILRDCRKSGTTVASLESVRIKEVEIPLPPLAEQRRIIFELERMLDFISRSVKSAKSSIEGSDILRKVILSNLASGGLEAGGGDPGSLGRLRSESTKKVDYSDLPALPKEWFWRRASDVCELISSGATPEAGLMKKGSGDVPFLKVYNLTRSGGVDFSINPTFIDLSTHEKMRRSEVRTGDVLTNIVGPPLGKTVIVPSGLPVANINQAIVRFRAASEIIPEWLNLALRSDFVFGRLGRTSRATAGQWNISLSACREVPIPVPPLDVQRSLLEKFGELDSRLTNSRGILVNVLLRLDKLGRALLDSAFTGKLVPQGLSDESATMLLEQIRAERAATPKVKRGRKPKATDADTSPANIVPILKNSQPVTAGEQTALEF